MIRSLDPAKRLRDRYGLAISTAMQCDVNGISWMYADLLNEAYRALQELEQDTAAGKVTAEDSELERSRLRAEAAAALTELDALELPEHRGGSEED